jgi:hypothetical protein
MFGVTGQCTRTSGPKRIADTHDLILLPKPAFSADTTSRGSGAVETNCDSREASD